MFQSCSTLCNTMDCSQPGSSVHGILQAGILEWGCHALLQKIFLTQGLNSCLSCLLHWQSGSLSLAPPGNPCLLLPLFSCPVVSDSLRPHGLQYTRPPCPSPSPEVCSNSYPLHRFMSIQPFHSLTPSSPSSLNLSQYQGLLQ